VSLNILAGDVGNELSVAVIFRVEDKQVFPPQMTPTESPAAKIDPQFQWHVEPRQQARLIGFHARKIVDAQPALRNQPHDLVYADFRAIARFQSATRSKAGIVNYKHRSLEKRDVLLVERAINEDIVFKIGVGARHIRMKIEGA
jgi:hypothetical protein